MAATVATVLVVAAGCGGDGGTPDATPEPGTPDPPALQAGLELVVDGLDVPNDLADLAGGRLLISDQVGRVHLVDGGVLAEEPVLDLTDRIDPPEGGSGSLELGLSGFAPHPRFADNGRIYVFYTTPPPADAESGVQRVDVLSEFTTNGDDSLRADPASERVLLRLEQQSKVHVGGHMAFGPDGLLYVGLGDGGRSAEAKDPATLPGSVVRIDPDGGNPYGIPSDNPFASGGGGAPEVYAYGFRNPWRVGWLDGVGLLVAEPKWTAKDQDVHVVVAGGEYGWPDLPLALPGSSCWASADAAEPLPECVAGPDGQRWEPPVVEYGRRVGQIVSGVTPYGGAAIPGLAGEVIVADWQGNLLAATPGGSGDQWPTRPLTALLPDGGQLAPYLWAMVGDSAGEVYLLTASRTFGTGAGAVYRLAPAR